MDNLALDKQLCFRVYSLNKTITKLYAPLLKTLNLTYPQYLVMLVLWESDTGVPIKHLTEKLNLDTGTLSPLLKRMQQAELLTRVRSEKDERSVTIALTDNGKALKQKALDIPAILFAKTGLSLNELEQLQQTFDKLLNATNAQL